jgi:pyruvate/2-oxoglutarate dehydrogenase complex dihydrolipoamide dehydrogenase (E3) component
MGDVPVLDSKSIMELAELPEHLITLGGGYIGLESAQMYRRFGSEVTIIQARPRLMMMGTRTSRTRSPLSCAMTGSRS